MIDPALRAAVLVRDRERCRWCGRVVPVDAHHIRYRRGAVDDTMDNLIALCRRCHGFVHGMRLPNGDTITKREAQEILWRLVERSGVTGSALRRQDRARAGIRMDVQPNIEKDRQERNP